MIYLDSSVALAHILSEDRIPPSSLWDELLTSSRLLSYELWTVINMRGAARSHGDEVRALLDRVALVDLAEHVLARALEPSPMALRTLDALHLATVEFLRSQQNEIELATYDRRLASAAGALGIPLLSL